MGHFAKFSSKLCYRMNFENNNGNSLDGINILLEKKEGGKRENVISQKEESCANLKIVELIFFFFFKLIIQRYWTILWKLYISISYAE